MVNLLNIGKEEAIAALRDHDPVHEVDAEEGNYWVLSRFHDIMSAAIDGMRCAEALIRRLGDSSISARL